MQQQAENNELSSRAHNRERCGRVWGRARQRERGTEETDRNMRDMMESETDREKRTGTGNSQDIGGGGGVGGEIDTNTKRDRRGWKYARHWGG